MQSALLGIAGTLLGGRILVTGLIVTNRKLSCLDSNQIYSDWLTVLVHSLIMSVK